MASEQRFDDNASVNNDDESSFTLVYHTEKDGTERQVAKVFLPKENIDDETLAHIRGQSKGESLKNVRIMPDCHVGVGCCIGLTSVLTDKVVPSVLGPDLGCGILTYPLGKDAFKLPSLDRTIRSLVPLGNGAMNVHESVVATDEQLEDLYSRANDEASNFCHAYQKAFGVDLRPFRPEYSAEWFSLKCNEIHANRDYVMRGLGTLGGGNHFIEININGEGVQYLTIHCGSRSFGTKIWAFHQNKITNDNVFDWSAFHKEERRLKKLHKKDKERYEALVEDLRERVTETKHAKFLAGDEAYAYYFDMIFAQKYAILNREIILTRTLAALRVEYDEEKTIESIHNYIDFQDLILRKGAISAHKDELCIVALNMRDGILICKGLGNDDWNQSCAHGCGRIMSRERASSEIKLEDFEKSMEGIYSTSVVKSTIDESPFAYKSSELIKRTILKTVEIVEQLRPILNIKATS